MGKQMLQTECNNFAPYRNSNFAYACIANAPCSDYKGIGQIHTERCRLCKCISFTLYQSLYNFYVEYIFLIRSNRNLLNLTLTWFLSVNPFESSILTWSSGALSGYRVFGTRICTNLLLEYKLLEVPDKVLKIFHWAIEYLYTRICINIPKKSG